MVKKRFGNGAVVGDDNIAIDYWYPDCRPIKLYFLTHLHADHIDGLTRAWSKCPIYTSELNCKLASKFIPGLNSSCFLPLKLNVETPIALTRYAYVI